MGLKNFYETVEDIVLYPGTLDELNRIERRGKTGKIYDFMPQLSGQQYIIGILVPTAEEFKDFMMVARAAVGALSEDLENAEILERAEELRDKLFSSPQVRAQDLRVKAKKIGAQGLIHVQLYTKDSLYMGVPVRQEI